MICPDEGCTDVLMLWFCCQKKFSKKNSQKNKTICCFKMLAFFYSLFTTGICIKKGGEYDTPFCAYRGSEDSACFD